MAVHLHLPHRVIVVNRDPRPASRQGLRARVVSAAEASDDGAAAVVVGGGGGGEAGRQMMEAGAEGGDGSRADGAETEVVRRGFDMRDEGGRRHFGEAREAPGDANGLVSTGGEALCA